MDWSDHQVNPTSGKFSVAWWLRQQNYVKDIICQETGINITWHSVNLSQYTQFAALPSTLCWGITRAALGTTPLNAYDQGSMEEDNPGWMWKSSFPNQPTGDGVEIVSSSTADTTQTITIYATNNTTGVVSTETVSLNGTTQVAMTGSTWGQVLYAELSAECAGTITIREASANQTITTIAAGSLTAGDLPTFSDPADYVIVHPNIYVNPAPSSSCTLNLLGGTWQADFTTDNDAFTALPSQFHYVWAHGTAAMAEIIDLYDAEQQGRSTIHGQAFWGGIQRINQYLDGINKDRVEAMRVNVYR
jgi:hypothetical protein